MAVYRYNVVVEVDIDTKKANQGNQEQKRMMRSLEQETIDSQRRMDNELEKSVRQHQQASHRAYNDRVADLRRQEQRHIESEQIKAEATRKWTKDFEAQQKLQQQALKETYRMLSDNNAFDGAIARKRKTAIEYGKVIDDIVGKTEKLSGKQLLGDSNTAERNRIIREGEDRQIKNMLDAQRERLRY